MLDYTVKHKVSQATLHRVFYNRFREEYPWLPTRIIKGCYRDAVRRARSFRELKKGLARTDGPVVGNVTIAYSDSQNWRLEGGVVKLRTHREWVKVHYRNHRQPHRYLYGGWELSSELKFKISGRKVILYLTFTKDFEITYNPGNVVAVNVYENNVTLALFRNGKLHGVYRVKLALVGLLLPMLRGGKG